MNVLQKRLYHASVSPAHIVTGTFVFLAILLLPVLFVQPPQPASSLFLLFIIVAVLLDVPGNYFLVSAVGGADLSLIGPLNAWKPLVAMLFAIFLIAEWPSWQGGFGMLLLFAGSAVLAPSGEGNTKSLITLLRMRAVQYRFLALVLTALSSNFLKLAIQQSGPELTFVVWAFGSLLMSGLCLLIFRKSSHFRAPVSRFYKELLTLAALFIILQFLTLQLFARMQIGYALAIFQLSAVISVLFGRHFFDETQMLQRLTASMIMVAGAIVILLAQKMATF